VVTEKRNLSRPGQKPVLAVLSSCAASRALLAIGPWNSADNKEADANCSLLSQWCACPLMVLIMVGICGQTAKSSVPGSDGRYPHRETVYETLEYSWHAIPMRACYNRHMTDKSSWPFYC
jgi:hypothetical protein